MAMVKCDRCGVISSEDEDACPACGFDEASPVAPDDVPGGDVKTEAEAQVLTEDDMKTARATILGGGSVPDVTAILVEEDLKKSSALRTERDLDDAVRSVQNLKAEFCVSDFRLGKEIARIHAEQLWKLRVEKKSDGKEKSKWGSFAAFCNEELGISPEHARRLMDVGTNYTEDQVRAHGHRKLSIVLQLSPDKRPEVMAALEAGASKREIEQQVKAIGAAGGARPKPEKMAAANAGKVKLIEEKKKVEKPALKPITVATIPGKQVIPLYAKPAKTPRTADGWKLLTRAKKLGDGILGRLELQNDVVMVIVVQENTRGELQLRITTHREEAPTEEK